MIAKPQSEQLSNRAFAILVIVCLLLAFVICQQGRSADPGTRGTPTDTNHR
jgi:hypothetical protein